MYYAYSQGKAAIFFSLDLSLIAYNKRVLENSQTTIFDMNKLV